MSGWRGEDTSAPVNGNPMAMEKAWDSDIDDEVEERATVGDGNKRSSVFGNSVRAARASCVPTCDEEPI